MRYLPRFGVDWQAGGGGLGYISISCVPSSAGLDSSPALDGLLFTQHVGSNVRM